MNITLHKTRVHGYMEFSVLCLVYLFLWAVFGLSFLITSPNAIRTNQCCTTKLVLSPATYQKFSILRLSNNHSIGIKISSNSLGDWCSLHLKIITCAMSAMIHGQIQTGMGRHVEYSLLHPGMLQKSMKASYWTKHFIGLLRFDMTSSATQKMFCIKPLWGRSTATPTWNLCPYKAI